MRKILEKLASSVQAQLSVTLDHAERQKSRGLLRLSDGTEAALLLDRGSSLRHGDRLLADDGAVIAVEAASEELSIVTANDPLSLMRAAYHLGNRHIPVQIEALRLAYLHDHVLDDMVRELGFQVSFASERFESESGAYGRGEHGHGHAHLHRPSERPRSSLPPPHHDHHHEDAHADSHAHAHAHAHAHSPAPRSEGA